MALIRKSSQTVVDRIERDSDFAKAVLDGRRRSAIPAWLNAPVLSVIWVLVASFVLLARA